MAYYKNELDIVKIVGKRLKEARILRGLTMQDVADKIGAGQSTVANWERGDNNISLHSLYLYCAVLYIHPSMVLPSHGEFTPTLPNKADGKPISATPPTMAKQKMTYQERLKFLAQKHADKFNDGVYKVQWFDMKDEAKVTIAAQAEAIREALVTWGNHGCNITEYLVEHGYVEPKTEDDAK